MNFCCVDSFPNSECLSHNHVHLFRKRATRRHPNYTSRIPNNHPNSAATIRSNRYISVNFQHSFSWFHPLFTHPASPTTTVMAIRTLIIFIHECKAFSKHMMCGSIILAKNKFVSRKSQAPEKPYKKNELFLFVFSISNSNQSANTPRLTSMQSSNLIGEARQ
ncbi:hypothetical protein OROHE_026804 [Orobanche hederae]